MPGRGEHEKRRLFPSRRSRAPSRLRPALDALEARRLLATVIRVVPEYNGQGFSENTAFPLPPVQVGTFSFAQELQGVAIGSATISGTFGNSTVPHSAAVDLFLDGIRIGSTAEFSRGPLVPWARTISGPELAVLQDGVAELTAIQNSDVAIRLGMTRLQITTSATPPSPNPTPTLPPTQEPPPTPNQPPPAPLTPGLSNPTEFEFEREPGDIRATAINLGAITESKFVEDIISNVNDIDFYRFTAVRGQVITFDIDAPGLDSHLKITVPGSGLTIAANNNGRSEELEELLEPVGDDSFVRFVAPADGTYFLAVSNFRYVIPYNPDTVEGRNFRGDPRLPETGDYRLIVRTPNIRAGTLSVERSQDDVRNFTATMTFEVRETSIDPRLFFSINETGNAVPNYRGRVNQRDTNGIPTNLIGSHTVVFDFPASVLTGNTTQFLNLDPPFGRFPRGVTIETNEFDNSFALSLNTDRFDLEDIPGIEVRRGWENGARLLSRWFAGPALQSNESEGNPDLSTPVENIDIGFILSEGRSERALRRLQRTYELLQFNRRNINSNSEAILKSNRLLNALNNKITKKFNSTSLNSIDLSELPSDSIATPEFHQSQQVGFESVGAFLPGDDLSAALGNFALYAAPIGTAIRQGNQINVNINSIAVYVRDSFDFNGEQFGESVLRVVGGPLGCWKLPDGFSQVGRLREGFTCVGNREFRDFRSQFNRGEDFQVYSTIRIIDIRDVSYVLR